MKNFLLTAFAIIAFNTATIAQNVPSYIPTNGLIAWWPFNGNANDESGNNNNGTSNGATLTTDRFGHADSAYLFDGLSSYISIPTSSSLESPATGLTMSAWVNLAGYSLVGQPYDPILTKSNSSANAFMYRFDVDLNGTGYYAGTNDWTNNVGVLYTLSLNQWYLLSAVLDSFTAYIYLNDTLVNTLPYTTNILNNTLPLEIGRDVPGITEVFNGKLDDIAIWNRALTQQELIGIYNGCAATSATTSASSCNFYTSPSGNYTWTVSGTYLDTLANASGCDSIITIDLTINSVNDSVTQSGNTLTALAGGAAYQWLDCNNDFGPISGATNQSFTAAANGDYSLSISQNGCTDTSICFSVTGVGINEMDDSSSFELFPNPACDNVTIQLSAWCLNCRIEILNPFGQLLYAETANQKSQTLNLHSFARGIYLIKIQTPYFTDTKKLTVVK